MGMEYIANPHVKQRKSTRLGRRNVTISRHLLLLLRGICLNDVFNLIDLFPTYSIYTRGLLNLGYMRLSSLTNLQNLSFCEPVYQSTYTYSPFHHPHRIHIADNWIGMNYDTHGSPSILPIETAFLRSLDRFLKQVWVICPQHLWSIREPAGSFDNRSPRNHFFPSTICDT